MSLTDTKIRTAKSGVKSYKLYDGGGLYLDVLPSGKKRWRWRFVRGGKESRMTLGEYPSLGLKAAREKRDELKKLIEIGVDPVQKQRTDRLSFKKEKPITFADVAARWLKIKIPEWRMRSAARAKSLLDTHVLPRLGEIPLGEITPAIVLSIAQEIADKNMTSSAQRMVNMTSQIMRYAVISQLIDSDPCRDLRGALPRHRVTHFLAITDATRVGEFISAIRNRRGDPILSLLALFLVYTFVRPTEAREMLWEEVDINNRLWIIPAHRMKRGYDHIVPLSRQTLIILNNIQEMTGDIKEGPVFQSIMKSSRIGPHFFARGTISKFCSRIGYHGSMTMHGVRAMASSLLNENGWNPDVIERQLAHVGGNAVREIYHRTAYIEERKKMMQWWADFMDGLERDFLLSHQENF